MQNTSPPLTYQQRLEMLRTTKMEQTRQKQALLGAMDYDDQGQVLPPADLAEIVEVTSGSGITVRQPVLKSFKPISNHSSGGFFGPKTTGENFKRLLEAHPTYINPISSMCGVYMVSFMSARRPEWNPDFAYSHLHAEQVKYGIDHGIGGVQHFCPDITIGLKLGWGGLAEKICHYRQINPQACEFYDGLEAVVAGIQDWIRRHARDAHRMANAQDDLHDRITQPMDLKRGVGRSADFSPLRLDQATMKQTEVCALKTGRFSDSPQLRMNLETMAGICDRIATDPPRTFREACQWLVFFQAAAKMYNGSGEWGQMDELLRPYYEQDTLAGNLTNEEAIFHLACLLLTETAYIQLGGPDAAGRDLASPVSLLILEAIHRLKIPANIAIRVGDGLSRGLFRRGIEILLQDKMGFPKFLGDGPVNEGFTQSSWPGSDSMPDVIGLRSLVVSMACAT
jgi:formate C-acetyltransferase